MSKIEDAARARKAAAVRESRQRVKAGAMVLKNVLVPDAGAWVAILSRAGYLQADGERDHDAIRDATKALLEDECRAYRKAELDKLVKVRTGALDREATLPPAEIGSVVNFIPSRTNWSYRPRGHSSQGRLLTAEEVAAHKVETPKRGSTAYTLEELEQFADAEWRDRRDEQAADQGVTEAEATADQGMNTGYM
jgi:hypothetical protein